MLVLLASPLGYALPVGNASDQHQQTTRVSLLQCLQALPQQTLMHAAQNLKKRAFWLNAEEAAELEVGGYSCRSECAMCSAAVCLASLPCWRCNDGCKLESCCCHVQRAAELKVLSQLVDSSEHMQGSRR